MSRKRVAWVTVAGLLVAGSAIAVLLAAGFFDPTETTSPFTAQDPAQQADDLAEGSPAATPTSPALCTAVRLRKSPWQPSSWTTSPPVPAAGPLQRRRRRRDAAGPRTAPRDLQQPMRSSTKATSNPRCATPGRTSRSSAGPPPTPPASSFPAPPCASLTPSR